VVNRRLVEAREKIGLTQEELAQSLGIKPRTYAAYERNERKPRENNLKKICDKLNVDATIFYPITKSEHL
jgi:transcriptional regulator with XRE-family HTH domain